MVDLHCHIIPSIDDGAKDIEIALKMLRDAEDDGIREIIATPHFMRGYFEVPFEQVIEKVEKLNKTCEEEHISIKIHHGQEIYLNRYTLEDYEKGLLGGVNGSNYYIFEMNMMRFNKEIPDILYELSLYGIKPIIAHPERYKYIIEDIEMINRLIHEGCLFQLNVGSIQGIFGKKIKKCAEELLNRGVYDFIGSDGHGVNARKAILRKTIVNQKEKNMEKMLYLIENNSDLLNGEFKPPRKEYIKGKGRIFSMFIGKKT
ncbi:tyrosine-protein phosphatase [Oceanirhabdus sp. W0125-5]|uniref:tyrosine-protein phosphatase n=1 Tax=Oceanirhabdus sp. W0125-5 TaxID=2999116 RepID=UPI0022F2B26F|nr:CpsB/CapC family capsule biosynthesis tyrosine phosphatase [Oceanirhabdus sp. W0125-5]WBW98940.1 exopolysaccharide biosynthesis protein [Oceanirhabdus sp. W0125-5]